MTQAILLRSSAKPKPAHFSELLATDLRALPIVVGLIVLWVFFAFESNVFLTPLNLSNLLVQSTVTGIMALGLMFVLLVKEIDLSIAAINGVSSGAHGEAHRGVRRSALARGPHRHRRRRGDRQPVCALGDVRRRSLVRGDPWVRPWRLNGLQLLLLPRTARYGLMGTGIDHCADQD